MQAERRLLVVRLVAHFTVGLHSLQARIPSAGTRELKSKSRQFSVLA